MSQTHLADIPAGKKKNTSDSGKQEFGWKSHKNWFWIISSFKYFCASWFHGGFPFGFFQGYVVWLFGWFFASKGQTSERCKVQLNSVCKFIGVKIICHQEEHICNWWLSISIYISVFSSNYFHWVIKTITVLLISNFKKTPITKHKPQQTLMSLLCFLSFLFLSPSNFSSTILHFNAAEFKHLSTWASWENIFSQKPIYKMGWCVKTNVLAKVYWSWCVLSRAEILMGRPSFSKWGVLGRPRFCYNTGEALPTGHSQLAAAGACELSKASICWRLWHFFPFLN